MMLVTPQANRTHLALPSCPPPPRVRRSKLSYFHCIESDGENDCDPSQTMFPALPLLYTGPSQGNEPPRTSNPNCIAYDIALKPRPMYGSNSFARISPSSPASSSGRERRNCSEDEGKAMPTVSFTGKVTKESTTSTNLLGCLETRRSSFSRAA
eukprot:CCRYP_011271-RA/>CCRYP_011271-RA protein AED:0.47 eAED:0.47 QI:0/-1/0/1/-1/1/1/0/153